MALLDLQSWSAFADADTNTHFDWQPSWVSFSETTFDADGGPFGNGAWFPSHGDDWIRNDYSFGLTELFVAFWWYRNWNNGNESILLLSEGSPGSATHHVDVRADGYGAISVRRGHGGTEIASVQIPNYTPARWQHMAVRCVINDTTGLIEIRHNGVEILNSTGLDTRNGGTSGVIDHFNFEGISTKQSGYAEPIAWSATGNAPTGFFGMHRVHMIKPDGDTSVQFTPQGAGSNYVEVDEQAHDDDTTYNESSTVTNKDTLTTESVPTAVNTIYGVKAMVLAKDPDGTATEQIKVGLNSGTESLSAAQTLTTGYQFFEGPIETVDPNTAAAWTETNVNATDVVYEHA